MTKNQILPRLRPSAEDRQLCEGVEWSEVEKVLAPTNLKNNKMSCVSRVFKSLHAGEGIQYIGKTPQPTEPKLEFKVGERIDMTSDFHSMIIEVNTIFFRANTTKGKDFVHYPHVTRDYMNGWTADDPLKRLAYAQAMIIAKRKQVTPNIVEAPDASDDDSDLFHSEHQESYDPGTDDERAAVQQEDALRLAVQEASGAMLPADLRERIEVKMMTRDPSPFDDIVEQLDPVDSESSLPDWLRECIARRAAKCRVDSGGGEEGEIGEDSQSSLEKAVMLVLPAIENGNSTNGSTDADAALGGAFLSMTRPNVSPVSRHDAVDVVTEPVPHGTPNEPGGTSSKRARDDMAARAEAAGLESAKRQRDDKIKAAENDIEAAEQELSEAVHAKEEELRLQEAAHEQQAVVEFHESKRRKRSANRKNHWDAVKRRQTDADGHLTCAICNFWDYRDAPGTQITDTELRLDHKIALCLCGKDDDPDNLQILCGVCDNRKTKDDMRKYTKKRMIEAHDLVRARATKD